MKSDHEIIVIGGVTSDEEVAKQDYLFDTTKKSLTSMNGFTKEQDWSNFNSFVSNGKVYVIDEGQSM